MAEHVRVWLGRVAEGQGEVHEAFVTWLQSDEASAQFGRYGLTGYSLFQHGDLLKVAMRAEEPLAFVRFLRDRRMWPECWAFTAAGRADLEEVEPAEVGGDLRVRWRRFVSEGEER